MKKLIFLLAVASLSGCATGNPETDARRADFNRELGRGLVRLISGTPRHISMEESLFGVPAEQPVAVVVEGK